MIVITHSEAKYALRSLNANLTAMDKGTGNPWTVAQAVGAELTQRELAFAAQHEPPAPAKTKTPHLLGCWVDGILRFQSRDHDAIREYAAEKMRPITRKLSDGSYRVITADVWVAPVGSFIYAEGQKKLEKAHA